MIPLWYRILIAFWALFVAGVGVVVAYLAVRASIALFKTHALPRIRTFRQWAWQNRRCIVRQTIVAITIVSAIACQWYFFLDTRDVPDMMEMVRYAPPQIGYIYDSRGEVMIELAHVFRKPLAYNELGLPIQQATIASEDKDFYEHDGIPITCVSVPFAEGQLCMPIPLELFWRWASGKGGSTLTMQLVRNHYLADMVALERTTALVTDNYATRTIASYTGAPWINRRIRKLREMKYALHLERMLTDYAQRQVSEEMRQRGFWWPQRWYQSHALAKRRAKEILIARYVSTVYYGYSMYGPDSASRFYFNRSVKELNIDEAALLASFAPAPSVYGRLNAPASTRARQIARRNAVMERMGKKGFIYSAFDCGNPQSIWDAVRWFFKAELPRGDCRNDVAFYSAKPLVLIGKLPGGRTEAPATVQTALSEVVERGFPYRIFFDGMIRLHTTNDLRIQNIVNRAALEGLGLYQQQYGSRRGSPQVAIIVLRNSDAAILAQFGGFTRDAQNTWTYLDRSRNSWRQPGSIFKVFVYLAALADGRYTPDSMVNDGGPYPIRMGSGRMHYIRNYTNDYRGWIPFREAIAQSRNVPAMHVGMEHTNLSDIISVAHQAGITSTLKNEASTILGASDITVIELANGFRTIASGGIVATPYTLDRITNSFGEDLDTYGGSVRRLMMSDQAIASMQELLRGSVRIPSGTARSMQALLSDVPLLCKTGTSNDFADARATCSTYGPTGVTISVWMGLDASNKGLGAAATGGRLALPIARYVFDRLYRGDAARSTRAILGTPPQFPEDMEERITAYIERVYPGSTPKK